MPELQARKIALAILEFEASRQELSFSPTEDRWERRAKRWGVSVEDLQLFLLQVRLPIVIREAFNLDIKVDTSRERLGNVKELIALAIIRGRGVDLSTDDFEERIHRVSRGTGIPPLDIWNFYLQFVIGHNIQRLAKMVGAKPLSITISDEPKTDNT